jgi:hypothetical protein
MLSSVSLHLAALCGVVLLYALAANAQLHPTEPARYQRLPPLREQAALLERWRQKRLDALPALMQEHGVDVWLVRLPSWCTRPRTEPRGR